MASLMCVNAFAAGAQVYGEKVSAAPGERVEVPVKIQNNPGLMGFKIRVTYPSELSSPMVKSGTLTGKGLLNDSITNQTSGSFDVVWTGSENAEGDGTLFVLEFKADKVGEYEIVFAFSQDDTFNEKWEDVSLDCKSAVVNVSESAGVTATQDVTQAATKPTEEIKEDYIEDVLMKVDSRDIRAAVQESLEELEVKSVEELPEEKQESFVKTVEEKLSALAPDVARISDGTTDTAQAVSAIERLAQSAEEYATQGVNVSEEVSKIEREEQKAKAGKRVGKTILIAVCAVVVLTATAVVIYKETKSKQAKVKEENTDEKQ